MPRWSLLPLGLAALLVGCGDEGPSGPPDAGPPPVDQCLGTVDHDTILSLLPDGGAAPGELVGVLGIAEDCGRGPCFDTIINDGDVRACMNACFDASAAAPLSLACRDCWFDGLTCVQENCLVICLGDDKVGCEECMTTHCFIPRMYECMGFALP